MSLSNVPTDLRLEAGSQTYMHCESSTGALDRTTHEGVRKDTDLWKSEERGCVLKSFDEQIHLPSEEILTQLQKAITFFSALRGIPEPVTRSDDDQIPFVELTRTAQVEGEADSQAKSSESALYEGPLESEKHSGTYEKEWE